MSNLLNILKDQEVPIDNQQIIEYLQGELKEESLHNLEAIELDDPLMQDAMEGLRMLDKPASLQSMTKGLDQQLQQNIRAQKGRQRKVFSYKEHGWILMTVVTILILILIAFFVIYRIRHQS
jgi:hypothetical protein